MKPVYGTYEELLERKAKIAYTAYGETIDHKNYQGLPMPEWDNLPDKIKQAWIAVAKVISALYESAD